MISAVMPTYARYDIAFDRGEGAYLFATDGRRYLDFGAGVAVTALGHCHPRLVAALTAQANKLWHCSNLYRVGEQERLARRLVDASFADTAFFCNSGAEALEGCIKLARKFQHESGHGERYRVLTFAGAFHGRTLATIAAGRQDKHLKGFEPVVDGFDQVAFGDLDAAAHALTARSAAILVEPLQGEGGIFTASAEFLRGLRALADERGVLLMVDEVQSGMGRTGRLFAHEAAGIKPDVMALAKGLGGGFPIGCMLATERAALGMTAGTHGSTFGGNPLATAVGNAVMDEMQAEGFLEHVQATGDLLRARLLELAAQFPSIISEVRGVGLMLGLKLIPPNVNLINRLIAYGLLTVPAGDNVVRLLPPLIIGAEQVEEAIAILRQACGELAA